MSHSDIDAPRACDSCEPLVKRRKPDCEPAPVVGKEVTCSRPPWSTTGEPIPSIFDAPPDALLPHQPEHGRYTFTIPGKSQIVISAPHGGDLDLGLPDRVPGGLPYSICTEPDANTAQLAIAIDAHMRTLGIHATLVVGKLHRKKVDLNRTRGQAAESAEGKAAWDEYHGFIAAALRGAVQRHGTAHLFDVHGHGVRDAVMVGHMIANRRLRECCSISIDEHVHESSYSAMANLPGFSLDAAIRGTHAIGTVLERHKVPAIPSQSQPCACCLQCCRGECPCTAFDAAGFTWDGKGPPPKRPCQFFWGAGTTMMYGGGFTNPSIGSRQDPEWVGNVASTQLETFFAAPGCTAGRFSDESIKELATALAKSIVEFMSYFYGPLQASE